VHEGVEAQVDRSPDAVALVYRDQSLTYRELDERANRVAAGLVAHGVGPDHAVGVFVDRSLEMVVGAPSAS
jgi:non-ribosomal peptide synthetase component F